MRATWITVMLFGSPLQKVQFRRAKALRVFEKAKESLQQCEAELNVHIEEIEEQINLLKAERNNMLDERNSVSKTAAKIEAILN